jgi:hypothetical protein
MADVLRIKRRLTGGAAGAPVTLANAELAYNEVDDKLYYGKGNNAGQATSIIPIAGPGMGYAAGGPFLPLTGGTLTGGLIMGGASQGINYLTLGTDGNHYFGFTWAPGSILKAWVDTTFVGNVTLGGPYLPIAGGALTGPLAINRAIPSGGNIGNLYAGGALTTGWVAFNAYLNPAVTGWLHLTGTGTSAVFTYEPGINSYVWYVGPNASAGATTTQTAIAVLNNAGQFAVGRAGVGQAVVNQGDATGSGYFRLVTPAGTSLGYLGYSISSPGFTIEGGGQFFLSGGNFVVAAGQVFSRGAGAMIVWDQRDNVGVQWAWYGQASAARLWQSSIGDLLTIDSGGNFITIGALQSNSGRIMSRTATSQAGGSVCCYEVPSGYAAGILQTQNYLYIARMTGDGSYHSTLAYFDLSAAAGATAMTMGGAGIRYPAAAYGSANVIAFGWGTYPAFPGHVAVSIDNGGAAYPIANASDARMKTDIAPSKFDALATINQIPLKEFRWIDMSAPDKLKEARAHKKTSGSLKRIGVVAQDVAKVFPEGVVHGDDHEDKLGRVWTLDQNIMIAALIGAIQQLTTRLEAVEGAH